MVLLKGIYLTRELAVLPRSWDTGIYQPWADVPAGEDGERRIPNAASARRLNYLRSRREL